MSRFESDGPVRRYPWTKAERVLVPLGILVLAVCLLWSLSTLTATNQRYMECFRIAWTTDSLEQGTLPSDCPDIFAEPAPQP